MNALIERLKTRRLSSAFILLATLSAGILIGSTLVHGVKAKEVDSSDAAPLKIPNPVSLSNSFSQIAKEVGPAVVNINTETLPKDKAHKRAMRPGQAAPQAPGQDDDEDGNGGGDQNPQGNFQDFFNRFFNQNPGEGGDDDDAGSGGGIRQSLGSGFIVDPKGYIITNNHVVDKADKIYVKLSTDPDAGSDLGRPAQVVGTDPETDLAVIKIDAKQPLPTVKLGNSDAAEVGDWVIAVGSPFSLAQTVTAGIVSAKNRTIEPGVKGQFQHFIQTDAAINPGNSGGPLLNMAGEVVGVNTAIYTQSAGYQGIGFAMPSNTVIQVYNDLIGSTHKVVRGSIGISFRPNLPSAVSRVYGFKNGVLISSVTPGQPADKAGLKPGDIIVTLDGRQIKDGDDLVNDVAARKPGSSIKVGYLRDGKQLTANLTIGDRSQVYSASTKDTPENAPSAPGDETKIGITVRNLPPQLATSTGLSGVLIQTVKPGSFADEIGLPQGMVILRVNRQPVTSVDQFRSVIGKLPSGSDVVFEFADPRAPKDGINYAGGTLP